MNQTLEEVVRSAPERREERRRLAELAIGIPVRDAEEHLTPAAQRPPGGRESVALMGQCKYLKGDTEEAEKTFQSLVIKSGPDSARTYLLEGDYWRMTGQFAKACEDAEKALEVFAARTLTHFG